MNSAEPGDTPNGNTAVQSPQMCRDSGSCRACDRLLAAGITATMPHLAEPYPTRGCGHAGTCVGANSDGTCKGCRGFTPAAAPWPSDVRAGLGICDGCGNVAAGLVDADAPGFVGASICPTCIAADVGAALGPRELACDCGRRFTPTNDEPERDQCMNCRAAGGPSYTLTTAGEIHRHTGYRFVAVGDYIVKWEFLLTGSVLAIAGWVSDSDEWWPAGMAQVRRGEADAIAAAVAAADAAKVSFSQAG